ncbi:MAG: hypothetical protein HN368_06305 [Spirochaetales bacterium]|nr:hypothetical protein [Spirochaetales bacterium]
MSYADGLAAINLEMPQRVPRTEYSAPQHWELVTAVTGRAVTAGSGDEEKANASRVFTGPDFWNFDMSWSTLIGGADFGKYHSSMGHAVYASEGTDYSTDIHNAFQTPEDALAFEPMEALGTPDHAELVERFDTHYRANCESTPDAVNMTGIYITCMSGMIDLFGWDILLTAAGIDQKAFGELANRYALWIQQYYNALADSDVPVVMVHDDIVWTGGAFIHPDWYRKYIFPNYKNYFRPLLDSGKKILYTSDGDYTEFIDDVAKCGVHGFVLEPLTDMSYVAEKYGKTHAFVGNADTRVLLSGTREDIRGEVERCMNIGKKYPGFIMAVGNHIPANTPVDSAIYYNDVYEELSRRK